MEKVENYELKKNIKSFENMWKWKKQFTNFAILKSKKQNFSNLKYLFQ